MQQQGALPFKRLANMHFNQHGGRRGVRSATNVGDRMMRKQAQLEGTIRPGPRGMGLVNPDKSHHIPTGHENPRHSHFHQLHERYNEK